MEYRALLPLRPEDVDSSLIDAPLLMMLKYSGTGEGQGCAHTDMDSKR